MTLTVITLATIDPTTTEPDVIADAEVNSVHEVYPEGDADPVWINPLGAVALPAEVVSLILNAAVVGLEGYDDPHAAEALHAISVLMANHTDDGMVVGS